MDDNFSIHLVSNVSTDIYPNNKPSQFSTLLADTVNLNNGDWEVAVKDIMYPSHVASTTEDDKLFVYETNQTKLRTLVPRKINAANNTVEPHKRYFTFNRPQWAALKKAKNGAEMVKILNNTPEGKKGIYQFEYHVKSRKMNLKINIKDFVITLSPLLSSYLGWSAKDIFYIGNYWAPRPIDDQPTATVPRRAYMAFYDLQYLKRTEHVLQVSVNESLQSVFSTEIFFDTLNTSSKEKFTFAYVPEKSSVYLSLENTIPADNRRIVFFAFDSETRDLIPSIYKIYGFDIPDINLRLDYQRRVRTFNPKKLTAATTAKLATNTITLTTWSLTAREEVITPLLSKEKVLTLEQKEFTAPMEFLSTLNKKKNDYNYEFTYDKEEERFALKVGKTHAIKMSDSLANILGFLHTRTLMVLNESKKADTFPLLHRAITDIYVYSNIVQEVYLGNVKAPLLLSCPFKRDGNYNNVTYIEFINPSFTTLNRNTLQQIDIDIRDAAGKSVPFLFGRTVLNLIFRRRRQVAL